MKRALKRLLGEVPLTAETYWWLRQRGQPVVGFRLEQLTPLLPRWVVQAQQAASDASPGKRVFVFATLHYWLASTTALSLALAGLGHRVTLGYLPYRDWQRRYDRFDLRRADAYARWVLRPMRSVVRLQSLLGRRAATLPRALAEAVRQVAVYDVQYTRQVERVDENDPLFRLRLQRNTAAAGALLAEWLQHHPDVVIIPNGMILEFGAALQTARFLNIPVTTYEFGEQRERVWLDRNRSVMLQDTTALWQAVRHQPLTEEQEERIRALFAARRGGKLWANFARRWQNAPSAGGEQARAALNLDPRRPVFLLATNVLGDSLVLGREIFTPSLAEWVRQTVRYFSRHPEAQLVVRIHPGEQRTEGTSLAEVVRPEMGPNIRLVPADSPLNTYDLIEIADAGLVFTTTVGLEMAMSGLPVVVAGRTHYRQRGFTFDPETLDDYFRILDALIADPARHRPDEARVRLAWKYAYHFFFDYPRPYPWHHVYRGEDFQRWSIADSLARDDFRATFEAFVGHPLPWETPSAASAHN